MYKESADKLTGNDRYEGYCIDLLRHIADILQFNYTIHKVKDNAYGSYDPVAKNWNGLVGELMNDVRGLLKRIRGNDSVVEIFFRNESVGLK